MGSSSGSYAPGRARAFGAGIAGLAAAIPTRLEAAHEPGEVEGGGLGEEELVREEEVDTAKGDAVVQVKVGLGKVGEVSGGDEDDRGGPPGEVPRSNRRP